MNVLELIRGIASHGNEIWAQVLIAITALGAFLKGVEAVLDIIAPLTPWKWDNDIAALLGKLLASKLFNKKVN